MMVVGHIQIEVVPDTLHSHLEYNPVPVDYSLKVVVDHNNNQSYLLELQATASAEQDAAAPVPVTLPLTVLAEEWGWHRHTVGAFLEGLEKLGFVTLERSRSSSTFTITTLSFPAA